MCSFQFSVFVLPKVESILKICKVCYKQDISIGKGDKYRISVIFQSYEGERARRDSIKQEVRHEAEITSARQKSRVLIGKRSYLARWPMPFFADSRP